jgi:hypothetical protein
VSVNLSMRIGLFASLAAGLLLSACTQSALRLQPDFGVAVSQDLAAQIADPDAHYTGVPAPGSDGSRVSLAQTRYQTGNVIPPAAISSNGPSTSTAGSSTSSAGSAAAPVSPPTP